MLQRMFILLVVIVSGYISVYKAVSAHQNYHPFAYREFQQDMTASMSCALLFFTGMVVLASMV